MSGQDMEQDYWQRVDDLIDLANRQSRTTSPARVSSSLLFAAARHNAFLVASSAKTGEELAQRRQAAVEHNVEQYRKMLEQNLEEYAANYDAYIDRQRRGEDTDPRA